jgi:hypothetical protein
LTPIVEIKIPQDVNDDSHVRRQTPDSLDAERRTRRAEGVRKTVRANSRTIRLAGTSIDVAGTRTWSGKKDTLGSPHHLEIEA